MESIDELKKTKSLTSIPSNSNPNPKPAREEGELSSSDDDENRIGSSAQSSGTANPPAPSGSILGPQLVNKLSQGIQAGKAICSSNPVNSVDVPSRALVQRNNDKNFEKNRVPFKSGNPGWHASSGANNNLVISFSDDDSGSESEDYRRQKTLGSKRDATRADGNPKLPSLSLVKSGKLQLTAQSANKLIPNKLSQSRTFISSMSKISGGVNTRAAGPSSVEQGYRARKFNTINTLTSQVNSFDQGVGLNNSKLRDLRQQIALRERELKLKAALQNKESALILCGDSNAINPCSDAVRQSNVNSVDGGQLESNEPDRKRLKVSESYSTQLNSDGQRETIVAKSILPLKEQTLENGHMQNRNMVGRSQKRSPRKRAEPSFVKRKKQDCKRVDVSTKNLPSISTYNNGSQSDKSSTQVDLCVMSSQMTPPTNMNISILPNNIKSVELNDPNKNCEHQPPGAFPKTATSEQNLVNSCENRKGRSGDKAFLNSICQAPPNNVSLWNYLSGVNVAEHSNMNMQSLVEMEESLDKELDEAQEHRRRCEIEERNAFKAYRKAQRALIEANSRCTELYRKREMHSTHFQSFITNDSSLLWSSRQHDDVGIGPNPANDVDRNINLMPTSSNQLEPQYDGCNQPGYDSNIHFGSVAHRNSSYRHVRGQNLGSEPFSEPAASTSEPLPHNSKDATNGVSSPSNDPNISADEDEETYPSDQEAVQPNSKNQEKIQNYVGRQNDLCHSNEHFSNVGSQDSLIYEATLRSELVSRLGMRILSKNTGSSSVEPADEVGPENDNRSESTQTSNSGVQFLETEKDQEDDIGGNDKSERSISEAPVQIQNHEKSSLSFHSTADSEDDSMGGLQLTSIIFSPPLVLRSAFSHMKIILPNKSSGLWDRKNQEDDTCSNFDEEGDCINSEGRQGGNVITNSKEESVRDTRATEIGSFTCTIPVDPFWPLCMYELRGKCNNDECPWQHFRDFSCQNAHQHQHDGSSGADCQAGLALHQKCNGGTNLPKRHSGLTPPTYLVGLDILKADPRSHVSFISRRNGECLQKCFSFCIVLSSLLKKDLRADEPFLRDGDVRNEVHGNWNTQSSYFQSRNNVVNHLNLALASNVQSLEKALLILSQEANKLDGMKKALSVLSRAVEADPTSEILWIIYLLIYYSNSRSVVKDDMFLYAVKHNERSYGLWLMYINSRIHLDERLVAYEGALKALCCQESPDGDRMQASACILDLFLQMMDCMCISGNVEKAIQKIDGLLPVSTNSDEPHSLLLSDILTCLTISDKYMFWVCCVYIVIYRKLPDAVVMRFECEKELLAIEWPSVHLPYEEKQRAVRLLEMAVDSVKLFVNSESLENETILRSAQYFSLSHMRCMLAIDGIRCCQNLLDKYIKLYPSCVELVVISARAQTNCFRDSIFDGFEEAISNWPKDVPGIHCIWNQYIECALQKGRFGYAKELLFRWFNSIAKAYSQHEILDAMNGNSSYGSLESASASNPDFLIPSSNQMDTMFGFINLSLAKLFQNDLVEARIAIERALKIAAPQYIKHCLREHAKFMLTYEFQSKMDASISEQLNILNGYLDKVRAFPVSEPLSRKFINKIEKQKVRLLISNMLSPVSSDFSLVNLVLEVWYGPSLLPPRLNQPKELVDFVEAILEIVPSNYQLVFSVCKLLIKGYNSTSVTSESILYWASSTLVSAIFNTVPIAPEYVWVEAACIFGDIAGIENISDRFYKRALSVFPFSRKLWNCYYKLCKSRGDVSTVAEAAREKGIEIG